MLADYQIALQALVNVCALQNRAEDEMTNPLIAAYFDESGKLHDHDLVTFAGYAAPFSDWEAFNQKWAAALAGTGMSHISMKDAIRYDGNFQSWMDRPDERNALLRKLAEIINSFEFASIVLPMTSSEFRALPEADRKRLKNVQYCGFEGAAKGILSVFPPTTPMHMVCDLSEEYAPECVRLFNILRANDEDFKRRCFAISFADDSRTPPLQAADMLAYCSRFRHNETLKRDPIVDEVAAILATRAATTKYYVFKAGISKPGSGYFE